MSLSPARQHRLRVQAEQAAREGGSVRHASGYDLMLLQLAEDRRRLKGVQSTVKKAEIKVELLPKYAAWAEGVLAAGGAQQDDVLMYVMLWRIDAGDYAGALEIGRHALRHGWVMPLGNRNVQTVLAEEMADAAQSAMLATTGFDADLLLQTLELTDGLDMPDQSRARLHKAIGAVLSESNPAAVVNFSSELLNKGNKTPAFSISIEGKDITTVLDNRLMSLTLTDNRGFEADQLDLELDDADGKIVLPRRGAVITLALGWKGQPLFPKGAFTVDEIEHTGAPDRLTIRARSADFRETLNTRREKSWHKTTVGEVVKEIAARHKLKMALGKDLSDKPVEHIDQTNESDGSFLMRLARQYGAIASVKNGNLLFIRQGQGKSASGKPLPVITITRKDGDSHRFTLADRGAYTGVIASWLHTREPVKKESTTVKRKRRTAKQKKEPEAKQGDYLVGTDENVLVLNRTYANRNNAERAAKMQWERLQRGVASFSLQLAEGRADLYTEMPVKVSGFKQPIDDAEWTITTLTHTVSPDNGFTTSIELEVKIDDLEME
ncbi:hypothetical protein JV469_003521 [Escherichia coli]|nr:hypothetical protein [Escherichia coli]